MLHKTFHSNTVRAKQGSLQTSRDNRNSSNRSKSAGANFRRYNEMALIQVIYYFIGLLKKSSFYLIVNSDLMPVILLGTEI